MVSLENAEGQEILCLWDGDVEQFCEDGFKVGQHSWHESLCAYANKNKLVPKAAAPQEPECDLCSACGEHADFDEEGSNCCGARPYDTDPDIDRER